MELRAGYKNTKVGVIPDDWEVKKLGDVLKVIGGGAFKSIDATPNGVKWLKIANVGINKAVWDDESYLPKELIKDNENFLLQENDYVLALTRPILDRKLKITKLNENDVPALLNQRVGKIVVENQTDIDFTYYLFQRFETINGLLQSMAGTDPPNLSNKGIYGIDCAIPVTKAEQTAIANALSDVDALINNIEKLITKKRNIKQGAMQKLLQPKEDWEVKTIQDLINENIIISHLDGNHGELYPRANEFKKDGIAYVGATDFKNGMVNFSSCKFLSIERANLFRKGIARDGDVLFAHNATVGPVAILKTKFDFIILSTTTTYFRCDNKNLINIFLFYALQSPHFVAQYKSVMLQSTRAQVPIGQQRKFNLILPNSKEQIEIAQILSDMDLEIAGLEGKLSKYRAIKMGMMQNLLTGKIRLV